MKWKKEPTPRWRIVRKFIWFPTCLNNEVKWLTWAMIKQERLGDSGFWLIDYTWENISWSTEKEYKYFYDT